MLHFSYGSNMSRPLMQRRCPTAIALGPARLEGWRFAIGAEGYATVVPDPGSAVHGVLWRLAPRDLAALNAYEGVEQGLYLRRRLPVAHGDRRRPALVYLLRSGGQGRPRPGYLDLVLAAGRDWDLPEPYLDRLGRFAPVRLSGARVPDVGEIA